MRTEVIRADTIDAAVERILDELNRSKENVFYFDGWDGLGASAVLQAVNQRLTVSDDLKMKPPGLEFEKIIHIDWSKWESRRAMQRAIAEQLELPSQVMDMFDKQDEEDDFNGIIDQGSRAEIPNVSAEIQKSIQRRRFLLILHNGSNEEIDITNLGVSVYVYLSNKMLWTFQGRFRLDHKMTDKVKKSTTTDVFLSASSKERDPQELWSYLVQHEATQVACKIIDPAIAAECFLYMLKQCCIGSHIVDYEWAIHTCNYWVCDGIIAPTDIDKAWQVGDALQRDMRLLDTDNRPNNDVSITMPFSHLARTAERMPYWISTATCGFVLSPSGVIPGNMFQHSDRLGVLKLSRCTFSFSSPPFLCCHSLRFLWLDHCQDLLTRSSTTDHHHADAEKELGNSTTTPWACFQSLWVLDLRYTHWDQILSAQMMDLMTQLRELNIMGAKNWNMSHLRGRLRNIRKLRITKSTCCSYDSSLFSEMEQMELLDFSENDITDGPMESLSLCGAARSSSGVKTVIIHEDSGFRKISLQGCAQLKNLLLGGSFEHIKELDLSGTTLQTIDLRPVEELNNLKRLLLLGCEKLRAILWPKNYKSRKLEVLRIDTTSRSASTNGGEENLADVTSVRSSSVLVLDGDKAPDAHPRGSRSLQEQKEKKFNRWRISLTDARLLRPLFWSLQPLRDYLDHLHIDICPAATRGGSSINGTRSSSNEQVQIQSCTTTMVDSKYRDLFKETAPTNYDDCDDGPTPSGVMMMWDCPEIFLRDYNKSRTCIIELNMHGQGSKLMEGAQSASTSGLSLPDFICSVTTSLHVYDNSAITSIPAPPEGSRWHRLRWCRVERCPNLHTVFITPQTNDVIFYWICTFWASQLPTARYIWNWPSTAMSHLHKRSFEQLEFLHLDYCPRLIHVLRLSVDMTPLILLETIEIVCCSDLTEVFPLHLDHNHQQEVIVFPKLRRIHLHEVPKLQRICGHRMSTPALETVKIRGCWSLRRLPAINENTEPPKVDCEKEWWDSLEWDGLEANHHSSLYEPSHSLYYKNTQMLRGTVLR